MNFHGDTTAPFKADTNDSKTISPWPSHFGT